MNHQPHPGNTPQSRADAATTAKALAVCSWSLQPANPADLVSKLQATGIRHVQLALDPLRENPAIWTDTLSQLAAANFNVVSGMFGCVGEDYSTLDSIRRTGGIAPDATWPQNRQNIRATAALAHELGLKLVTFHAGFVPHSVTHPSFAGLLERLGEVAAIFASHGIAVGLETGQETAGALRVLLEMLGRPNLGVNFDPANMILYDKGDPVEALQRLGHWVRQVHLKDAKRTRTPGTWGKEVPLGTGDVDWRAFFAALKQMNFTGNCVIEREAGTQRIDDIRTAADLFRRLNS